MSDSYRVSLSEAQTPISLDVQPTFGFLNDTDDNYKLRKQKRNMKIRNLGFMRPGGLKLLAFLRGLLTPGWLL